MNDRFRRTCLLLGEEALARLGRAQVLVAGLGAVGSFAVEGLARSGVGGLRLVDFDRVEPSNINRQLYALETTLGEAKTRLAAARVRDINPACRVETVARRIGAADAAAFLLPRPDVVIDAIDDLPAKVGLLAACVAAGVPVVSSMGAARRHDPLQVRVGSLTDTRGCPLARAVRRGLRQVGAGAHIRCVFSSEPPAPVDSGGLGNLAGRRAMGSSVCVTGTMGLVAAREAMKLLLR